MTEGQEKQGNEDDKLDDGEQPSDSGGGGEFGPLTKKRDKLPDD